MAWAMVRERTTIKVVWGKTAGRGWVENFESTFRANILRAVIHEIHLGFVAVLLVVIL